MGPRSVKELIYRGHWQLGFIVRGLDLYLAEMSCSLLPARGLEACMRHFSASVFSATEGRRAFSTTQSQVCYYGSSSMLSFATHFSSALREGEELQAVDDDSSASQVTNV